VGAFDLDEDRLRSVNLDQEWLRVGPTGGRGSPCLFDGCLFFSHQSMATFIKYNLSSGTTVRGPVRTGSVTREREIYSQMSPESVCFMAMDVVFHWLLCTPILPYYGLSIKC
jgi:hypothetical protein